MPTRSSFEVGEYVPVSLIKEWLWCPVIAWLEALGIPEPLPSHAKEPEVWDPYEVAEELITYLRRDPKYVVLRPKLKSRSLGIAGAPDLVITYGSEAVVAEFKTTSPWVLSEHVKLQLCAYALMVKECFGAESVRAFIVSKLGYFEVEWVKEVPKLLKVVSEVRKMLATEYVPEPKHEGIRCRACPYARICRWGPG